MVEGKFIGYQSFYMFSHSNMILTNRGFLKSCSSSKSERKRERDAGPWQKSFPTQSVRKHDRFFASTIDFRTFSSELYRIVPCAPCTGVPKIEIHGSYSNLIQFPDRPQILDQIPTILKPPSLQDVPQPRQTEEWLQDVTWGRALISGG